MFSGLLRMSLCLAVLFTSFAAAPLAADWTLLGPDGGSVMAVASAPSRPALVYAATEGGQSYRSLDRGQLWAPAGRIPAAEIVEMEVDPVTSTTVYAATSRGLFQSTDSAATWTRLGPASLQAAQTVAIHPRRPALLLASFADSIAVGGTLYRSTDRGRTWTTQEGWPDSVWTLALSPASPGLVWAGTSTKGVSKSTDFGRSWRSASTGLPEGATVDAIAADPRSPQIAYTSAAVPSQGIFKTYKTTDGGATWTERARFAVSEIVVDPLEPSYVYAIVLGQMIRSTNGGASWVVAGSGGTLRPGGYDLEATRYGLFTGSASGLFLSTDRAVTWKAQHKGITAIPIAALAIDQQDPPRLYASNTRIGIFKSRDRGASWLRLGEPEDFLDWSRTLVIDPSEPETVYTNAEASVARSTNGGRRWEKHSALVCGVSGSLFLDPREPSTLYTSGFILSSGCGQMPGACLTARSLDAGETWSCIAGGLPSPLGAPLLGIDPFTSAVYAQVYPGDLWKSTDRGTTWTQVYPGLNAQSFAPSPLLSGTLYAGGAGFVRRSRDGGQTWQSFEVAPETTVIALAPDPTDRTILYASTGTRVYKSTDEGETWTALGTWPADAVPSDDDLLVDPQNPSIVYAGTINKGVLRYQPNED